MSRPFVSVLTPTANRRKFIPYAIQMFKAQTYPQASMEWIILDDGTDKVGDLFAASGLKNVRYVALDEKLPIGAKRNRINELAKGEICVCWDDDDYYCPDRVRQSVTRLRSAPGGRIPVAGCSHLYLYYTDRKEIWSVGPYNRNHCTNGTMAYWRSYFKTHKYDDKAEKAEERAFMENWTTQVLQQEPEDVMLVICHSKNTFDKRKLLEQKNPSMKKTDFKLKRFVKDKRIIEFYNRLTEEYKEEKVATAVAPVLSDIELNPALEFIGISDVSSTDPMPGPGPGPVPVSLPSLEVAEKASAPPTDASGC
jgi:glycosyltransferase involved in cell wall biosynthesis